MTELIFTWSIENFSYSWHESRERIISPTFIADQMQNSAWTLEMFPRGSDDSDYLSLYLYRSEDQIPVELSLNFELSCISADTSVLRSSIIPENFVTFASGQDEGYGEPNFIHRHEIFGRRKALYLPNDVLTLRCRMWTNEGNGNVSGQIFGRTRLTTEEITTVVNINRENKEKKNFHIQSKLQNEALMSFSVLCFDDKIDVEINSISEGKVQFSILKFSAVDKKSRRKLLELESSFYGDAHGGKWRLPFSDKMLPAESDISEGSDLEFITELVYSTGEDIKIIEENCPPKISEFLSDYMISCVTSGQLSDIQTISENLWNLFNEQVFYDLEIKTHTTSFFVHKIVLCAHSSVFLSMLTSEMTEKINECIEIEDIADGTLEVFLKFIYTDSFKDLEWDAVMDLYYAADKYQVERLKLLCCSYLLQNVDVGNFLELLILADSHNDCELKRKVCDFIWENDEEVFRPSTWTKFAYEQQRKLALQIMLPKYEEKGNHGPAETYEDKLSRVPRIRDNFRSIYQGHIVSDVVVKSEGASFPAHKAILCACSPTFREVFRNDLGNKSTDSIEMGDWDDDTVSRMLLFLYTDLLEDMQWDFAINLYQVADAYQIQRLQYKSSCFLVENLRVSNATNLLLLAHDHNDVNLKSIVEDYICLYDEEIFESDEWTALSKINLLLAYETMSAIYKKK